MDTESVKKQQQQIKEIEKLFESRIDTEDLICEVEKQPAIWDSRLEAYSDKIEKINSWNTILKIFIPEFEEKTESEKNILVTIAQKKWRSIRICYARELQKKKNMKTGSEGVKKRQYVYFDQLRFLENLPKKTANNVEEEDDNNPDQTDICAEIYPVKDESSSDLKKLKIKRKRIKNEDNEFVTVLKKKVAAEEAKDEDRHFLLSLLSEIRKVPSERRLKLRSDIISVIAAAQAPDIQSWSSYAGPFMTYPFPQPTQYHPSASYQASPLSIPPLLQYSYPGIPLQIPPQQLHPSGFPLHQSHQTNKPSRQHNSRCHSPASSSLSTESQGLEISLSQTSD